MSQNDSTQSAPSERIATFLPRADIEEREDGLVLYLDLPGVREDGLDVHFEKNTLTVTGRIAPLEFGGVECVRSEGAQGRYRRAFTLSEAFDAEKISASLKDGLLKIQLPKSARQMARKIPIRTT